MIHRFRWLVIEKTTKIVVKYSAWTPHNYPSFSEFCLSLQDKSAFKFCVEVLMQNGVQQIVYDENLEKIEKVGYLYLQSSSGICRFGGMIVFTDEESFLFNDEGVIRESRKN